MASASDFVEYTIGHPEQFEVRVRECVDNPRNFPLILRYMGDAVATGGRLRIEVVIDPARETIPIRLLPPQGESQRISPARGDACHSISRLLKEHAGTGHAIAQPPPPVAAPAERKPKARVGETLSLF